MLESSNNAAAQDTGLGHFFVDFPAWQEQAMLVAGGRLRCTTHAPQRHRKNDEWTFSERNPSEREAAGALESTAPRAM